MIGGKRAASARPPTARPPRTPGARCIPTGCVRFRPACRTCVPTGGRRAAPGGGV